MGVMNTKRSFLALLGGFVAATPAIVRIESIMPVRSLDDVPWMAELDPLIITPHGSLGAEYMRVVRKAFIPRLYVQAYAASPMLDELARLADDRDPARSAQAAARSVPARAFSGLV
jgi:hypothetical protein